MIVKNESKVSNILEKRQHKEISMKMTQEQRNYDMMLRKEMEMIKREERLENVERIGRVNENKKMKVMQKIE